MPITAQQFLDAIAEHHLSLREAEDGWHAETRSGTRLHRGGKPTPAEAVEAALASVGEADERERNRRAWQAVQALDRGRYFLRPRAVTVPDGEGGTVQRTVFDAFQPGNGRIDAVQGRANYLAAVADLEALLGP